MYKKMKYVMFFLRSIVDSLSKTLQKSEKKIRGLEKVEFFPLPSKSPKRNFVTWKFKQCFERYDKRSLKVNSVDWGSTWGGYNYGEITGWL